MDQITLYLGKKQQAYGSLCAWLMLLQTGEDFQAIFIKLAQSQLKNKIRAASPLAKLPVIIFKKHVIWNALAIGEYLAETYPHAKLWPLDTSTRAMARSIAAEMHAELGELAKIIKNHSNLSQDVGMDTYLAKLERVVSLLQESREQFAHAGPYLFGHFTIADAIFAPMVLLFLKHNISLPPIAQSYVKTITSMEEMKMWHEDI